MHPKTVYKHEFLSICQKCAFMCHTCKRGAIKHYLRLNVNSRLTNV